MASQGCQQRKHSSIVCTRETSKLCGVRPRFFLPNNAISYPIPSNSFDETKDLTDCISVLIDGDQAVNWRVGGGVLGIRRSVSCASVFTLTYRPFRSSRNHLYHRASPGYCKVD